MDQAFINAIDSFERLLGEKFRHLTEKRTGNIAHLAKAMAKIHGEYVQKIRETHKSVECFDSLLKVHQHYLNTIQSFNKDAYPIDGKDKSKNDLTLFFKERDLLFSDLPIKTIAYETEINRQAQKSDSFLIRSHKRAKRFRYGFIKLFKRKGSDVKIKRWVPLKYYFIAELYVGLFPQIWDLYKELIHLEIELLNYLKNSFTQINNLFGLNSISDVEVFDKLLQEVVDKCNDYESVLSAFTLKREELLKAFILKKKNQAEADFCKLGTLEARRIKYGRWYTNKSIKSLSQHEASQLSSLEISLFSISEDWSFDTDLYLLKNKAQIVLQSNTLKNSIERVGKVQERLKEIEHATVQEYEKVNENLNSNLADKITISEHSEQISLLFSSDALYISKLGHSQTMLYALNEIEQEIISEIETTNDKRMISEGETEWDKMQLSKLNSVYLKDLIKFEIQPQFSEDIDTLKQYILQKIAMYESEISNLVHISAYNFETINAILDNGDSHQSTENTLTIIEEGKQKVTNKIDEVISVLKALQADVETNLVNVH